MAGITSSAIAVLKILFQGNPEKREMLSLSSLRILFFVSILSLSGCAAAPMYALSYAMSAGVIGYTGYSYYELGKDSTASFEIERNDPDAISQSKIKKAKSIAIYPAMNGADGEYVDTFRNGTDMKVISSSRTISYLKKRQTPNLTSLPQSERVQAMARLGRDNGADLTIVGNPKSPTVDTGILLPSSEVIYEIEVSLVDTREARVLWQENQKIVIDGIQKTPSTGQVYNLMATGAAERLMDIRLGRQPKSVAEKGSFFSEFACGGKYNPVCDHPSSDIDSASTFPEPQNQQLVRSIQSELGRLGHYRDAIDGQFGARTRAAIIEFQMSSGIQQNGEPTQKLLKQIEAAVGKNT